MIGVPTPAFLIAGFLSFRVSAFELGVSFSGVAGTLFGLSDDRGPFLPGAVVCWSDGVAMLGAVGAGGFFVGMRVGVGCGSAAPGPFSFGGTRGVVVATCSAFSLAAAGAGFFLASLSVPSSFFSSSSSLLSSIRRVISASLSSAFGFALFAFFFLGFPVTAVVSSCVSAGASGCSPLCFCWNFAW